MAASTRFIGARDDGLKAALTDDAGTPKKGTGRTATERAGKDSPGDKGAANRGQDYRAFLKRVTGQESAAGLNANQRGAVLDELRRLGFRSPRTIGNEGRPGEPQERLAMAIWRDLGDLGVLHDPSDTGLRKFAATLTGLDRMEWANAAAMNKVVEALKAWKRREQLKHSGVGQ